MAKYISIILTSFMIVLGAYAAVAAEHSERPEADSLFVGADSPAGKIVIQFHDALKSAKPKLARSLLSDDVVIYEGGRVERSADEYANHHMLADMKYASSIASETLEHQVMIVGNIAISSSRTKSTGQYKGKPVNRSGMETIVLRKTENGWRIIRIHWS